MSLFMNGTDHWEIPSQGELHSGDTIEVYLDGQWVSALVDYRPRIGYTLRLNNNKVLTITDNMEIRSYREISRREG
jgi:hypothetical protein